MPGERSVTVPEFLSAKKRGAKLSMLTAYDYTFARIVDEAGIDGILVGDSLGMVMQGHQHSLTVTLDEILYHTRCVARGVKRSLLVSDLPFMTYQPGPAVALQNAGRLIKEGGAQAVKLEGGRRSAACIEAIAQADIPIMGHVGMTPQSVHRFGGFRLQKEEERILADAKAVEAAGAFAVVLECIPAKLAQRITAELEIPTIGIGAGPYCDGQILVLQDMLGMYPDLRPKFVKLYADLQSQVTSAVQSYAREVLDGSFPSQEQSFRG